MGGEQAAEKAPAHAVTSLRSFEERKIGQCGGMGDRVSISSGRWRAGWLLPRKTVFTTRRAEVDARTGASTSTGAAGRRGAAQRGTEEVLAPAQAQEAATEFVPAGEWAGEEEMPAQDTAAEDTPSREAEK